MRYVFAGMLCVLAIVPAWLGGVLGYFVVWPHYLTSGSTTSLSVGISSVLGLPSFDLQGGEALAFFIGCLLLAAGFFTAAGFLFFKRSDTESSASD